MVFRCVDFGFLYFSGASLFFSGPSRFLVVFSCVLVVCCGCSCS